MPARSANIERDTLSDGIELCQISLRYQLLIQSTRFELASENTVGCTEQFTIHLSPRLSAGDNGSMWFEVWFYSSASLACIVKRFRWLDAFSSRILIRFLFVDGNNGLSWIRQWNWIFYLSVNIYLLYIEM